MLARLDIETLRKACRAAAETLAVAGSAVKPGVTTEELDRIVHNDTVARGGLLATLNYRGFPKSCCTSVNDVVCHGIPGKRVLKDGDIVNIDVTTIIDGHFGDCSATFLVGNVDENVKRLVEVTRTSLDVGISQVRPGVPLNEVGKSIQAVIEGSGYTVVKEFGGHGIGTRFHLPPHVSHYDNKFSKTLIVPGMVFTVEPIVNMGTAEITLDNDGWTVRTADGKPSAQFEHTLLVTDNGCEILTKL